MKQILPTLIFCLVAVAAFGQIKVNPVVVEAHFEGEDLTNDALDLTIYFDVENERIFNGPINHKYVLL